MYQLPFGSVAETVGVILYAGLAAVLTLLGAFFERASIQDLTAGEPMLGLWELAAGTILLYAAYNVAVHLVGPRLRGSGSAA